MIMRLYVCVFPIWSPCIQSVAVTLGPEIRVGVGCAVLMPASLLLQ